ncbi:MAG: hypothetical protein HQM08_07190 [Candidatus Riflebacteria bacterium]|nr:hypothetical protein [Candidatus Riflebacteria bacterium]
MNNRSRSEIGFILFLLVFLNCTNLFAAPLNLVYERVIYGPSGNQLGVQKVPINSTADLPGGSPWIAYLNQSVGGGQTLLSYTQQIAGALSQPLNLTISDQNFISCSTKDGAGYEITLYKHVLQYTNSDSQKFIFLHEMGHIAMLNAYPSYFTFAGLNYGPGNCHYLDQTLPDPHTAWVEGWADGFAANKNNGKIFTLSMSDTTNLNFLKGKSFEEMTRNELFNAKVVYDMINQLPSGKDKVFNALTYTGPHNTLQDFCRGYLSQNPQDQIALAQILDRDSQGAVSPNDLLNYVNGGSNQVGPALNSYLTNKVNNPGSYNSPAFNLPNISNIAGNFSSSITNFFSNIGTVLKNIFGSIFSLNGGSVASTALPSQAATYVSNFTDNAASAVSGVASNLGEVAPMGFSAAFQQLQNSASALSPTLGNPGGTGVDNSKNLAAAEEEYFKAFHDYNVALGQYSVGSPQVTAALEKLKNTKNPAYYMKNGTK